MKRPVLLQMSLAPPFPPGVMPLLAVTLLFGVALGACALVDPIEDGYELQPPLGSGGDGSAGGSGGEGGDLGPGGMGGAGMGGDPSSGGGGMGGSVTWTFGERPTSTVSNVTADTQVNQVSGGNNYGGVISAWADNSGNERRVALLRFDVSMIPPASIVESAVLSIYTHDHPMANTSALVEVFEVLESWVEGSELGATGYCNWFYRTATLPWTEAGVGPAGSRGAAALGSYSPVAINVEYTLPMLRDVVQSWVSQPANNHGMVFVNGDADGTSFKTKENTVQAERPELTVTFTAP